MRRRTRLKPALPPHLLPPRITGSLPLTSRPQKSWAQARPAPPPAFCLRSCHLPPAFCPRSCHLPPARAPTYLVSHRSSVRPALPLPQPLCLLPPALSPCLLPPCPLPPVPSPLPPAYLVCHRPHDAQLFQRDTLPPDPLQQPHQLHLAAAQLPRTRATALCLPNPRPQQLIRHR